MYVLGTQKNRLNGDGSFEHPKQTLNLMDKKIFTILQSILLVYQELCVKEKVTMRALGHLPSRAILMLYVPVNNVSVHSCQNFLI